METRITGKAWVGGDNISTYDITPQRRWNLDKMDPEELGKWAMEDADPAFADKEGAFRDEGYSVVVAGACFGGGGKSIEHPIYALQGAGIKVVIADSFARFNFRNSVNNALPAFTCPGLKEITQTGDELTVDLLEGYVENHRTGVRTQLVPLTPFALELMEAGGLIPYTKAKLKARAQH